VTTSPVTRRSRPQSDDRQESATEASSESKQTVALGYFSSYLSVERESMQGKVKLTEASDTTGVV
jgi:hypothetical protein